MLWKTLKMALSPEILLRVGLAFSFFYAAFGTFIARENWIGFFPSFLFDLSPFSQGITLGIFSVSEIIIGLWLMWGRWAFWSGLISAVLLAAIVVFNFGAMDIVFRDISLMLAALALALLAKN